MYIIMYFYPCSFLSHLYNRSNKVKITTNLCSYRYNHVAMYMTIVTQMEMTSVQIQLHDLIWTLITKCLIIKKMCLV
jgi:hypothetical protein